MPSATEGHRKRPRSSRFENRHIPWPVVPDDLDQVAAATAKDEQMAVVRITLQRLLNQKGQAVEALPHIGVACRQPDAHAARERDHPGNAIIGRSGHRAHGREPRRRW